jgi:hypothetical protein
MSRILRRPMFRGGRVESRGTGITSGLGYASGGQVTPKRGLVDGPGGYAGYPPTVGMGPNMTGSSYGKGFSMERLPATQSGRALGSLNQSISYNTGPSVSSGVGKELMTPAQIEELFKKPTKPTIESRIGSGLGRMFKSVPKGLSKAGDFVATQFPKVTKGGTIFAAVSGPGMIAEMNRPKTYAALDYMKSMNQSGVFDETAMQGEYEGFAKEFNRLNDTTKYTAIPDERGFFNKLLNPMSAITGLSGKTDEEITQILKTDEKKIEELNKPKSPGASLGNNGTITDPVKTDRQVIQEYMDMFKENLGGDTEDLKRSRYLELAKFGANLLGQPGGQSLGEAVGRAAAPTLEGFSKIEATERAGDRQAKALGFQAALRELEPGSIGKAIKDLKKVGFSDEKAKEIATKTGDNTRERTQEDRIKEFTKILMDSGVGTSKVSRSLAEKIEQSGLGMSGFESKEEAIKKGIIEENQLYFDKQGKTYKGKKVGDEIKLIEVQFTKSK